MIPSCPPYIIQGVYRPPPAIVRNGCRYTVGHRGPIIVRFYPLATGVPLEAGQAVRFAPDHGYYAYPPSTGQSIRTRP